METKEKTDDVNSSCSTFEIGFSKRMRLATRDIHKISDALVNAKLAFALSDNSVWTEGLLIFYEIFKYLEENTSTEILPIEYYRTLAFEADLSYYLGENWKQNYFPRSEVLEYLDHLKEITSKNPILLMAYTYHLYMGLLSGGQILQKKRSVFKNKSLNNLGENVTYFENYTIPELKTKMRHLVDEFGKTLDEEMKLSLLDESKKVFQLNNRIIRTVRGVSGVGVKKILLYSCVLLLTYILYWLIRHWF